VSRFAVTDDGRLKRANFDGCLVCGGTGNVGAFEGLGNASASSGNYNSGLLNGNFNGGSFNGNGNVGAFNGNLNGLGYSPDSGSGSYNGNGNMGMLNGNLNGGAGLASPVARSAVTTVMRSIEGRSPQPDAALLRQSERP
jgi:hypothetical protein